MNIKKYSTNKIGTNCYLVEHLGKCIVIDPCVKYEDIFQDESLELAAVFITHGHFDHIDQLHTYLNKGIKFYMHMNAYNKLLDPNKNVSAFTGFPIFYNLDKEEVIFVEDKEEINLIGKTIEIMYTPGHTDCSIMLIIDDSIFSGDMVFRGSIGRYDLYSASYLSIMESIEKIKQLTKNYTIYPGHGNKTSLEFERQNNPYFR